MSYLAAALIAAGFPSRERQFKSGAVTVCFRVDNCLFSCWPPGPGGALLPGSVSWGGGLFLVCSVLVTARHFSAAAFCSRYEALRESMRHRCPHLRPVEHGSPSTSQSWQWPFLFPWAGRCGADGGVPVCRGWAGGRAGWLCVREGLGSEEPLNFTGFTILFICLFCEGDHRRPAACGPQRGASLLLL